MVRDYRAGLGMPRRAKIAAIASIVVVCGLSAFVARGRPWLSALIAAAGVAGVAWIAWRVPTKPERREHAMERWTQPAPVRPGEELDWDALETYLRAQLPRLDGPFEVCSSPAARPT